MKSLPRSRRGEGLSWDSNPGLPAGSHLKQFWLQLLFYTMYREEAEAQRGQKSPWFTQLVRDLQSQSPGVSHPELFLPAPARTIIHSFIHSLI